MAPRSYNPTNPTPAAGRAQGTHRRGHRRTARRPGRGRHQLRRDRQPGPVCRCPPCTATSRPRTNCCRAARGTSSAQAPPLPVEKILAADRPAPPPPRCLVVGHGTAAPALRAVAVEARGRRHSLPRRGCPTACAGRRPNSWRACYGVIWDPARAASWSRAGNRCCPSTSGTGWCADTACSRRPPGEFLFSACWPLLERSPQPGLPHIPGESRHDAPHYVDSSDRPRHLPHQHGPAGRDARRLFVQPVPGGRRETPAVPHRAAEAVPADSRPDRDGAARLPGCATSPSRTSSRTSAAAWREFLAAAPDARPVCSEVAAMVSVGDMVDVEPLAMADGQELSLGRHRLLWQSTPHLPAWLGMRLLFRRDYTDPVLRRPVHAARPRRTSHS